MQAVVDSLLTHYDTTGKGPVLLMLHGWGDSSQTFDGLAAALSKNFRIVRLDLPGFGATQAPASVWGLDEYADFVRAALVKLDTGDVFAVIAHSNGAALAMRGLATGTLKAHKLVLIAAAGIRDKQKTRRMLLKSVAKTGKAATFWLPERHKRALRKKLYGVAGSDMMVAPHLQETFKRTVRQDVQADAAKLTLPTLLIYGADDQATPPTYGRIYQKLIAGSRLEIVDGAGHFVHHDQPDEVIARTEEFLTS